MARTIEFYNSCLSYLQKVKLLPYCRQLLYPYRFSPFMSKDKFSMANELNRAKKYGFKS